jgi:ribosomal protein S18 acetylase RimI-like enzyme
MYKSQKDIDILINLYQLCFPSKNAESEIKSLGNNFDYTVLSICFPDSPTAKNISNFSDFNNELAVSFVIYRIISNDEAEIIDIGTIPSERKQGYAKKILNNIFNLLKNNDKIETLYLEVAEDNLVAINLYKKLGFEHYSTRKNYYLQGNKRLNAILMKKTL